MNTENTFEEGELVWMFYKDAQNVTQCKPVVYLGWVGTDSYAMVPLGAVLDGDTIIDVPIEHLEKINDIPSDLGVAQ